MKKVKLNSKDITKNIPADLKEYIVGKVINNHFHILKDVLESEEYDWKIDAGEIQFEVQNDMLHVGLEFDPLVFTYVFNQVLLKDEQKENEQNIEVEYSLN